MNARRPVEVALGHGIVLDVWAYVSDTPGLVIVDFRSHFSVTHQRSGLRLAGVSSFDRAVEVCKVLGAFSIDWTLSGTGLRDMTEDTKPARAYLTAVHIPVFSPDNVSLFEELLAR